ncbi:Heme/copper-type cytochrome/quinol oxidase, subunit 3 [Sphingomonas sp. NFR04]|uniref:cytochrome c oxidase subunit 3 n=1 Tax=Sphingomonas sp. NFR04 TaxID=1566283 RepID=UPI0008E135A5|nr:cytochrome c oxidase subunit 3 [Sphingomonas sp. NFR04]SFK47950.1 Heme/copper-type cytochrome/quinol oxidase, subunit 3 [Sphingomonas sp. NFR04]
MSDARPYKIVGDVSDLPESASGAKHLVWWGNIGFMAIEGTAFALAAGTYLYLMSQTHGWPPAGTRPPDLLWPAVLTLGLFLSEIPNLWVRRRAIAKDEWSVRFGTLGMTILGLLLLIPRGIEFAHLNVHWSDNAYGSLTWMLIILHTSHLITDIGDTAVQAVWLFTHEVGDDQFADVEDNANYWTFVVLSWLPVGALIYLAPRLG